MNIVEEIGHKYSDFGVLLLNDTSGSYVDGIANQLQGDFKAITSRILTEWINGRPNSRPYTWQSLIETLGDIGLKKIAKEIQDTLLST